MVGFCLDPRYAEHQTLPHHPERPDRIRAIHAMVRQAKLLDLPDSFPDFQLDLGRLPESNLKLLAVPATVADECWVEAVHPRQMMEGVRRTAEVGGVLDLGDTPVSPGSYEIALLAVGGVLNCVDAVMKGQVKRAFAAVRPPGHHAEPEQPMGFCLFSNVAIAGKYLQTQYGVERIGIVDFDVHHGNGTQAAFDSDPRVYFISLHQHPRTCYPGSGYEWEMGTGSGRGFTLNLPFDPGADDADYLSAITKRVVPVLDQFRPEVLLVSAGFDAHRDDPLAHINLSEGGYERMTQLLVQVADQHCRGRMVSVLEGGYNLRAMARSVLRHVIAMDEAPVKA